MRIATLDIASNTGLAYGEPGGRPRVDLWTIKERGEHYDAVAGRMGQNVRDLCINRDTIPHLIVFEKPIPPYQDQGPANRAKPIRRSMDSIIIPQRAVGALQGLAACFGVKVVGVDISTWRKHFLGSGRAAAGDDPKAATIARCILLGYVPAGFKDDNICDALGIWDWACATHGRTPPKELHFFGER